MSLGSFFSDPSVFNITVALGIVAKLNLEGDFALGLYCGLAFSSGMTANGIVSVTVAALYSFDESPPAFLDLFLLSVVLLYEDLAGDIFIISCDTIGSAQGSTYQTVVLAIPDDLIEFSSFLCDITSFTAHYTMFISKTENRV